MLRLLGAALVTLSASLVGFGFARGVRRQCAQLEGLFFEAAGRALSVPPGCTVPVSFKRGFQASPGLSPGQEAVQALYGLSMELGRFDLESQLAAIERAKGSITSVLLQLQAQKRARCRSYETIGICAGLALAVILL